MYARRDDKVGGGGGSNMSLLERKKFLTSLFSCLSCFFFLHCLVKGDKNSLDVHGFFWLYFLHRDKGFTIVTTVYNAPVKQEAQLEICATQGSH